MAANTFALNFNFSSGQAFHQAPADNNSSARVIPISRPAAHDEETPEAINKLSYGNEPRL